MVKCSDGTQKIDISKHKSLMPLAMGNIDISIDATHDNVSFFRLFKFITWHNLSFPTLFAGQILHTRCSENQPINWIRGQPKPYSVKCFSFYFISQNSQKYLTKSSWNSYSICHSEFVKFSVIIQFLHFENLIFFFGTRVKSVINHIRKSTGKRPLLTLIKKSLAKIRLYLVR